MGKARKKPGALTAQDANYGGLVGSIGGLLDQARRATVRTINSIMTAAYYEVGRRIVEFEQAGKRRAGYGEELLKRLAKDLTASHGRGFSERNLEKMRSFYLGWEISPTVSAKLQAHVICPTVSGKSEISPTVSAKLQLTPATEVAPDSVTPLSKLFPLSWSQYVRLMAVQDPFARAFYETEALRGGWSVRQLDRQISTQFYERTALSRKKEAMLAKGQITKTEDAVSVHEAIRDPYVLEFLNLKDEYSESDLEDAIILHLEGFLLELGVGFTFMARQKRIRIGDEWYRIDLLLFHRGLRCLVVIDLKIGKFTHADAGQMTLYLNYVKQNIMMAGENEPVGLILCSEKDDAVVHYATDNINAKVFASKYLTVLPDEETLRQEILNTQRALARRAATKGEAQP